VIPLSLLGHQHPAVLESFRRQLGESPHPAHARFAQRLQADAALLAGLDAAERAAWERLGDGPVDMELASARERSLARALARLERRGLAIYSGFTPTDAAHVLGHSEHWDREAARLGALIWSRQMQKIHGLGRWVEDDAEGPSRRVFDCVVEAICNKLIEAGLNDAGRMNEANAGRLAKLLSLMVLGHGEPAGGRPASVFEIRFTDGLPLVAVGAPAGSWYPPVAAALGVRLEVPRHGEVANAVGAVLGRVAQRVHLGVTQPTRGVFRVFTRAGPVDFAELEAALEHARGIAGHEATAQALAAGAATVELEFECDDTSARDDDGTRVFFEARVTATASGPPRA